MSIITRIVLDITCFGIGVALYHLIRYIVVKFKNKPAVSATKMIGVNHNYVSIARLVEQISAQMLAEGLYYILPTEGNVKPNVSHINNGCCSDFANRLISHIGGEYIWREEFEIPHAFVLYDGRYYDSETPYGVSDWRKLPIWKDKFNV